MQTNDLYFNLATFLQLLHFLCNKRGAFRDKYRGIIPNWISCKVAVYEETFCQRELGEHDERFWSHRKALPAPCLKLENWIKIVQNHKIAPLAFLYFIVILFFSKSVDNLLLIWYNYFVNFLSIYQLIWGVLING